MEKKETIGLPEAFIKKMEELLGDEAVEFFASYQNDRKFGLRVNPLKTSVEDETDQEAAMGSPLEALTDWDLAPIPWAAEGFYYGEEDRPGRHSLHEAGAYYIQEPSAMAVAEALKVQPGERILDLCAAPGGKSTHLAGKMAGQGILVSNEIHPARAKILSQNMERMGVRNSLVTNMEPAGLIPVFSRFFDGIVVDAPCSGEGMFRKDENARSEWSPDHVVLCADRQDSILDCAAQMLRPGGRLVYSTCTFSPEENEGTIARFMKRHPEYRLERPDCAGYFSPGRPEWADGTPDLEKTVRIWPHKAEGEGHFLALLVKNTDRIPLTENTSDGSLEAWDPGQEKLAGKKGRPGKAGDGRGNAGKGKNGKASGTANFDGLQEFILETFRADSGWQQILPGKNFLTFGEHLYLVPEGCPELSRIRVLRAGLQIGTLKKGRLEPAHGLALALSKGDVRRSAEIGTAGTAARYLRGEALGVDEVQLQTEDQAQTEPQKDRKGWTLITTGGYSLGWAKLVGPVLKNHYPKGIRKS